MARRPGGTRVPDEARHRPVLTLIERYLLKASLLAFAAALFTLTAVIWLTQALKEFNLLTLKGQSLLIFLSVTGLAIPALVVVIAPIALFLAVLYALNRLSGDSELIVMNAAGLSPSRLLRPFAVLAGLVVALVGLMSLAVVPWGMRTLRDIVTEVQADFITHVVQPGAFTSLDQGFTFHYRERGPDGSLRGIFIQDRRDPAHVQTIMAERGATEHAGGEAYLVLEDGNLQRESAKSANAAVVVFKSYQLDLTQFGGNAGTVPYKPRERSTLELLRPDPKDPYVQAQSGRFRAELVGRCTSPLYALTFGLVGMAALGEARSTRQGRGRAMALATLVVLGAELAGMEAGNLMVKEPWAVGLALGVPVLVALGAVLHLLGLRASLPRLRGPAGAALPRAA